MFVLRSECGSECPYFSHQTQKEFLLEEINNLIGSFKSFQLKSLVNVKVIQY